MTESTAYQSSSALAAFLRSLAQNLSLAVIAIGIVVIVGWVFDQSVLKTVLFGFPTMKFNAALCFIFSGSSLWLWQQQLKIKNEKFKKSTQSLIFSGASLIILITSLTLIQYGLNLNLGIDQLLMQQPEPTGSLAVPGRMAPNTALAFLLAGSALLSMNRRHPKFGLAHSLAILIWLISLIGLLGHIYGSVYFYTAGSYTGMALHAAIGLQLLSLGILCATPNCGLMLLLISDGAGSMMMRHLLPVAIVLPSVAGGLALSGYRMRLYSQEVEVALANTLNILVFAGLVSWNAHALNRMDRKRRQIEYQLQESNVRLEQHIVERTAQLRDSEQRLNLAIQAAEMGTWDVDLQTGETLWNTQHFKLQGYDPSLNGEASFEKWLNRVHPDDQERVLHQVEQAKQERSLYHPEHRVLHPDTGVVTWLSLFGRFIYNDAGEALRFTGVSLDITNRKQTEETLNRLNQELEQRIAERTLELQESNSHLQYELFRREQAERQLQQTLTLQNAILSSANFSVISATLDGTITSFNTGAEKMLGYTASEIVGKITPAIIHDPQEVVDHAQRLFQELGIWVEPGFEVFVAKAKQGEIEEREWTYIRKDGSRFPVLLSITALCDQEENITGFLGIASDISDRKRIETALRQSEEQFRHAFEDASMGIALVSLEGRWLRVNPALCQIVGYTAAELLSLTFQDITHPDDLEADLNCVQRLLADEISTNEMEKRYLHKNGEIIWILLNVSLVRDEQGDPLHIIGQIQNITDRKQSEAALRESEARYRAIVEDQTELICRFLPDSTILFVNDAYCRYFGLKPEEIVGQSYQPKIFEADQERVIQLVAAMNRDHPTMMVENRVIVQGEIRWTQWSNRMLFNEQGEFLEYQSVGRDITDLKRAELERQVVSDRLNFLLNYSPVVIFSSDPNQDYAASFISENVKDILGYEAQAFLADTNFWLSHLHPSDLDRVLAGLTRLLDDDFHTCEYRLRLSDGVYRWFLTQLRLIRDAANHPVEILGYLIDISDRKQTEAQLYRNEAALIEAQRIAHLGSWELDLTIPKITWSEELFQMFGFDPAESPPPYEEHFNYIYPDDRELLQSCITQASQEGTPYKIDLRFFRQDGTMGYMEARGRAFRDEQGQITRLFGTALDISSRKQAEEAQRQSESTNRALINAIPDVLIRVQADGTYLDFLANSNINFIDPDRVEAGLSIYDVLPHEQARERLGYIQQVLQTNQVFTYEYELLIDNQLHYEEARIVPVQENEVLIVVRDISDRKLLEEERKASEAALRRSEARFQMFMDHSPAAAWITDANGRMLYVSQTYQSTFQLPTSHVIGKSVFELYPTEVAQQFLANIQTVSQTRQVLEGNESAPRSDGTLGIFRVYKFPMPDALGQTLIGGVAIDITQQYQAEVALQKSEQQLQMALEASGDGLWDWSIATGDVYYNPQYLLMLGYEVGELPNTLATWEYLTHPDDHPWVLDILNAHLKDTSAPYAFDYRVRTKSGEWKWIAVYGRVVARDEQGNPLRMIGTHRDVSDRKQIEAALQKSIEHEQAIAEVIQQMRQTLNLETIFTATTRELRRVLNCDRVLIYRFNPDWSGTVVAESMTNGWISVMSHLIHEDAFPLHTLSRDRCSIQRRDHQETVIQDTYLQQTQGKVYCEGTQHTSISDIYTANFEPCYIELLESLQARAYLMVPIFSNHKLWGLLGSYQNSSPREWSESEVQVSNQIVTQLGIAIQQAEMFTQIQQQSNELQQAKEVAEVANQAKSIFLANMSHELRTPLNVILGFTQVLRRDTTLAPIHQETIQTIHRSGEHLLSLINDILDLSKIEADRTLIEATSFDLFELLHNLEEMLCHRAISKNLQFRLELASDVPQFITTDANKLRQILINLLSNAIKFTEQGYVMLRVSLDNGHSSDNSHSSFVIRHSSSDTNQVTQQSMTHDQGQIINNQGQIINDQGQTTNDQGQITNDQGQITNDRASMTLLFEVEDTGVGIAEDEVQDVFDAFVQSRSGKMAVGGTGLGLTISRRFARLMHGDIVVTSSPGHGSTFCLQLPVQVADVASVPLPTPQRQFIGLVPGQPTYRILIVDDQPENRSLLARLMTQLGMEIREATNGQEAVTLYQQWHPHLVWMDIRMPVLDGYEATQQIRSLSSEPTPVVIALTAQASMSDRGLALRSGCNDFVTKPFNENLLYDKMAEYLNLQFAYAESPQHSNTHAFASQNAHPVLTAESFAVMPEEWLTAVYHAAQVCDEEEIEQLLHHIPEAHVLLANQLRQLIHDYQFGQIKRLLREHFDRDR
ncbi:MAG: PAS domain S-box protein [Leptolyngbyaceae cyanobacterium bins.302]|nr:PAS domain S-box protein [Leptolyngbyaceae cyanobacterium bins.302]